MGFIAGAANALAGGGTFLTFPTLVLAGFDPINANATSTVLLLPGGAASAWVYRSASPIKGKLFWWIIAVCVVGGVAGSQLLLFTPSARFARIVPFLMLAAAIVYTFSAQIGRFASSHTGGQSHPAALLSGMLAISIYGGYFGAGMGVLLIVLFAIAGQLGVQESAGLRMMSAVAVNFLAMTNFIIRGIVDWRVAIPMTLCAIIGGYVGAHAVKRLTPLMARRTVLIYAWLTTGWLLLRPYVS